MKYLWVKFLQEYIQKAVGDTPEKTFKKDAVIQLEESVAKALISLKIAEETEEPAAPNLDDLAKNFEAKITALVEESLTKAISGLTEKFDGLAQKSFATPKNRNSEFESETGFKSEEHFWKCVQVAGVEGAGDIPGMEFLHKAPSGQSIGNDPEGGFLVPEPILNRIWSNLVDEPSSILPQTLGLTTAGNSMKVRRFFESSRKTGTGQRNGGIVSYWVDEAGEITASKFTTGKESLELHKLAALVYATSELLEDGTGVTRFIQQLVPRAINYEIAEALLNGSGVGKPLGVLKSDALIVIPTGTRAGGAQSNHTILHWNVSQMYHRNINRGSMFWYAHPDLIQQLEFVTFDDDATNKRPIFFPAGVSAGLTQSPFGIMYGRPVVPYEFMPDFGSQGDIASIDWSQYATLTKAGGGMRFAESIHVRFIYDETAFRFTFRIDGRPLWTSPKEDLNGDTTRSPFVTLASRTGGSTSSGL